MALTVRDLVGRAELGLRWVTVPAVPAGPVAPAVPGRGAGPERADRPVTWVHISELDDPTPFLAGGEVLLTTGLTWAPDADAQAYVGRLVDAGVVGLGVGTGLTHEQVPPSVTRAAGALALPLFEVPRATPFIAISRAVSRAIAADEYAAVQRTFAAQQALTRAALSDAGAQRVVRLLARQVPAAVVLLDAAGTVVESSAAVPAGRRALLRAEVLGLAGHAGAVGAAWPDGADTVSLQAVGSGRSRTFLAVARETPLTPDDRHLVNAAVLLLTIRQERVAGADDGPDRVPAAVLDLVLGDGQETVGAAGVPGWAASVLSAAGTALPSPPWVVGMADGSPPAGWAELADSVPGLVGRTAGRPVVLLGATGLGDTAAGLTGSRPGSPTPELRWGFSRPVADAAHLPAALREAQEALTVGQRTGETVTRFDDVAGAGWSVLVPPERAAAWAAALLAPVRDHRPGAVTAPDGPELLRSLRAWLLHHGQWDPAAAEVGLHRHTLRKRIRLIEGLLGRSLEAPGVRAEVWLALEHSGIG